MAYVRVRSWHVLSTFTRDGGAITRCGRRVPPRRSVTETAANLAQILPADKSCETCLRLNRRDDDRVEEAV